MAEVEGAASSVKGVSEIRAGSTARPLESPGKKSLGPGSRGINSDAKVTPRQAGLETASQESRRLSISLGKRRKLTRHS